MTSRISLPATASVIFVNMTINHLKLKLSCSLHPEVADYLAVNDDE